MTQTTNLSKETKELVSLFVKKYGIKNIFSNSYRVLMTSLYATRTNADKKILDALKDYTIDLSQYFTVDEIVKLQSEYNDVIVYCYESFRNDEVNTVKNDGGFIHPYSIIELLTKLSKCKDGSKVFLPYANIGQLACEFTNCECNGFEVDGEYWSFSQIILQAYGSNAIIVNDDLSQTTNVDKYDLILSCPPFGIRDVAKSIKQFVENNLADVGNLYFVLPMSFCWSKGGEYAKVRKFLVVNGYNMQIIALPSLYEPATAINTCILHVTNKKERKIDFFDMSSDFFLATHDACGYLNETLKTKTVIETIEQKDEKYYCSVEINEGIEDLELTPKRFISKDSVLENVENPTMLKDLIETYKQSSTTETEDLFIPYGFSSNWMKSKLELKTTDRSIRRQFIVNDGHCVLAMMMSNFTFHIGTVDAPIGSKIFVSPMCNAFRIKDENIVTKEYLLQQLTSDFVSRQAEMLATGLVMPRIAQKDFLSIQIPLPSIGKQRELTGTVKERDAQQTLVSTTVDDITHMLSAPMYRLKTVLGRLSMSASLSDADRRQLKMLTANYEYIKRLLDANGNFDVTSYEDEEIDFLQFANEYVELWNEIIGSNTFAAKVFANDSLHGKTKIVGKKDALMVLFDCLFDNAHRHGFNRRFTEGNIVEIILTAIELEGKKSLNVEVRNNGVPFPDDFSLSDYIAKGKFTANSGRTGLGGYHVNMIIQSMGGILSMKSSQEWTSFVFSLPMAI